MKTITKKKAIELMDDGVDIEVGQIKIIKCPKCGGKGLIASEKDMSFPGWKTCQVCDGKGSLILK